MLGCRSEFQGDVRDSLSCMGDSLLLTDSRAKPWKRDSHHTLLRGSKLPAPIWGVPTCIPYKTGPPDAPLIQQFQRRHCFPTVQNTALPCTEGSDKSCRQEPYSICSNFLKQGWFLLPTQDHGFRASPDLP